MEQVKRLARELLSTGSSALHVGADAVPSFRTQGRLVRSAEPAMSGADLDKAIAALVGEEVWARAKSGAPGDVSFLVDGMRVRGRCFMRRGGPALVLRPGLRAAALEDLGLPPALKRLAHLRRGLLLIAGPSGSGKSTTVAAMVREIDTGRPKHIVMLESPIEIDAAVTRCMLTQRQIGRHTPSYAAGLRAALRQCPDVISVGDLPDGEAVHLALEAAAGGTLVLATLRARGVVEAIERLVSHSALRAAATRHALAESLAGAISQLRLPTADGQAACVAAEVLLRGRGVAAALRSGELPALEWIMQREEHMQTMDDDLETLLNHGFITQHDASAHARDKERFRAA